jgi:heavy metal sensor kinase
MVVTASLFSFYVYDRAERGIGKDAKVLIRLQLAQCLEYVQAHPGDESNWALFAARQVAAADPDLRLGIQVFAPDGRRAVEVGSVQGTALPLPRDPLPSEPREVDLGRGYPFLALAGRSDAGAVQVLVYSRLFERTAARVRDAFLRALPLLVLLTAGLGWALSRGSLRPIAAITRTAQRISASQLDESIPRTGSGDELDELARTLNDMLARVRGGVERVRRFSVDAAHQLRTPLAALQNEIDVTLAKARSPAEYQRVLEDLRVQVETLSETVNGMLRLAQSEGGLDPAHRQRVEIDPLLAEVAEFFGALAEEHGLDLVLVGEAKAAVIGDPVWLHQLFANLLHNAVKYTPEGGRIEVGTALEGGAVRVRVRDTGVGMTEADRAIAFERLRRGSASSAGDGMGLGLALAHEIARAHGGSIQVESSPGHGSVFTVRLPVAPPTSGSSYPRA